MSATEVRKNRFHKSADKTEREIATLMRRTKQTIQNLEIRKKKIQRKLNYPETKWVIVAIIFYKPIFNSCNSETFKQKHLTCNRFEKCYKIVMENLVNCWKSYVTETTQTRMSEMR